MMFWKPQLTTKVASSFLLLSLLSVGVVGGFAFWRARAALKAAAFDRLQVSASLKEEEIVRWFEDQERDFFLLTQFPDIQRNLKYLLDSEPTDPGHQSAHQLLSTYLTEITRLKPNIQDVSVLDRSNRIVLSTERVREGEYEVLANITYLDQVESGSTFAPIFYVSSDTGRPAVTLAAPLLNQAGDRQGLILANLNLSQIDQIVRERIGLGESGETYLIGSLVIGNTFISKEETQPHYPLDIVSSDGIDAAMRGERDFGLYNNYANVPVIGVYRWLNDLDIALLAEMSQDEAFSPARELASTIVFVGLISVGFLTVGIYWLTKQLHLSRIQLENYSHKLEQKAQEANAANLAKSKFLANMSHELRTPLNAILGFSQLMVRDRSLKPSQLEQLDIINRSGEHLLTLINDVLEMSKIEAGRITLNQNSFNLHRLLDSLEDMLQLKARSKGLRLVVERAAELPQYVETDEGKLRQVLINLIGNAIKFTSRGNVTLTVRMEKHRSTADLSPAQPYLLCFTVQDTGTGIAPHEMDTLFEPFVQTESGRTSKQGTGLGLPISRQYVGLMGGKIEVRSVVGQGTTFSFTIQASPALAIESARRSHRRVIGLAPDQTRYRILVVEDKWENRQLLVKMLEPLGLEVREAENGKIGVALWEEWEPHLIWMDMRMPIMDGYEATKQIRSQLKGHATVIIALTASAFEEARSIILAAGCDDFVRKPFQEHVIFDKMADYLGLRYVYADGDADWAEAEASSQYAEDGLLLAAPNSPAAAVASTSLTPSDLTVMPPDWIDQLYQAATRVNSKQVTTLIGQIPASHANVANVLLHLVNQFQFEEIVALTQPDPQDSTVQ
ncbi:response regulator [Oculatella sp. LEGE 06141]|uniref:hybrid sensor histidine kinase/response regulator n=1 Tax=Oculatella sp. LEGE 06141 TaxID=1828648 RepID=UPI00187F9B86|nr:hybrid sensor histidine kinase/response regulator [Oculatella sp. LEGE 06141]MBE9182387.1 response regulator [Oculatella sp. LEGE 06141]